MRWLVVVLALLVSCAAPVQPRAPRADDRAAWESARAAAAADAVRAPALLESFARANPRSAFADDAALQAAELRLARGETDGARALLAWVVRSQPNSDRADLARLRLAQLELEAGRGDAAWAVARGLRIERLPEAERVGAARLMADLAEERGDRVASLRQLAELRGAAESEEAAGALDAELDALLTRMSAEELARAAEQLGRSPLAARLRLRQAERALAARDFDAAAAALDAAAGLPLGEGDALELERLRGRVASRGALPDLWRRLPAPGAATPLTPPEPQRLVGSIGVVLPLTGPFARYGEESLQGVLLAAGVFPADGGIGAGFRVRVRDSGGSPERAAEAVRELARENDLAAIVGPLLGDESEAAAAVAEAERVPLLALTRREEVAPARSQVLRMGLTPRLEVDLLVDYAMSELGARRFAILHPTDGYGQRLRALFWDAVEAAGGEIVGVAGYDPEATDFADPIRELVGFRFLDSGQRAALARRRALLDQAKRSTAERAAELREEAAALVSEDGEPLPPFIDFDALFIPDAHANIALIAPQLAFHEVRGVRLLGTSGWNHPDLVRIGRRHVNGALFPAAVNAGSRVPYLRSFARRFRSAYRSEPGPFAAEAYDSTAWLLDALASRPPAREALRRQLLAPRVAAGVSGTLALRPDGSADKRAHLLGVEREAIVSVDELGRPPLLPHARDVGAGAGGR